MKTEIIKVKGDWQEVVNDCRATVKSRLLGANRVLNGKGNPNRRA